MSIFRRFRGGKIHRTAKICICTTLDILLRAVVPPCHIHILAVRRILPPHLLPVFQISSVSTSRRIQTLREERGRSQITPRSRGCTRNRRRHMLAAETSTQVFLPAASRKIGHRQLPGRCRTKGASKVGRTAVSQPRCRPWTPRSPDSCESAARHNPVCARS